jgi:transposase
MSVSSAESVCTVIGVGIDTARYGHRVSFLRADKQPAAPALDVLESREGYESLAAELHRLHKPGVRFHIRVDTAGQFATNLEQYLRGLPLPIELSMGEPARNAAYRKVHFPKRKSDATDSLANARFAVVECPAATPGTLPEFIALREVVSQLESQTRQTTRLLCQLHNLLARVFPELATLVRDLSSCWLLELLSRYPTPARIARARPESLESIPYLKPEKAALIQQVARNSVGSLSGEIAEALVEDSIREILMSRQIEKRLKKLLRKSFTALPDGPHKLLTTITGIGPCTAAAIVAKVVSIDRFATPDQLVSYFGVFPEERTSGYDRFGHTVLPGTRVMSRQGNDLVRGYLWMAAQTATMHNPAIKALYARQKARGKRGDVALGHCMRKLIHLVFAIWKTGRPFDPTHYPWENAGDQSAQTSTQAPNKMQMAAGHNGGMPLTKPVITAAAISVKSRSTVVNRDERHKHPRLDYAAIRQQITMTQVLDRLGCLKSLKGRRPQLRGPCPIHGQADDSRRSFSVHLDKQVFRCFHEECAIQGNVLDLWAAVRRLPLHEATVDLVKTFNLAIALNREEEPVRRVQRKPR